jgi:hypothetical protein
MQTTATATRTAVVAAVQDVIAAKVANLPFDDGLGEYRAARHAAVRTLAVWVKNSRTVVVDVTAPARNRHMAAEILDVATADMDLGPDAEIIDLPTGAAITW